MLFNCMIQMLVQALGAAQQVQKRGIYEIIRDFDPLPWLWLWEKQEL
ncbi:hypothetical protein AGMMS49990_10350 [Endomicrobiia bacterium]|nr:hypothetical protein AGMMS49990_10350 [Endomicrobiia bacterium]